MHRESDYIVLRFRQAVSGCITCIKTVKYGIRRGWKRSFPVGENDMGHCPV